MVERSFAADPEEVTVLRDEMARGSATPAAVLQRSLKRIEAAEPSVQGWRIVDHDGARAQAERLSAVPTKGALHGVPVAVKDVIDVAGFPTRAGSRSRENAAPATADAVIVSRLRAAGAIIVGKAHTTEFAFFDGPPPTRNPHDLSRTPGGSSSGPAAVVASGMVPLSVGTQTAGSVSRPAAYCGIAAFKPSTLSWPTFGVVPFAPSFDTVGVFGYRIADAAVAARALMPDFLPPGRLTLVQKSPAQLRIAIITDPILGLASAATAKLMDAISDKLKAAVVDVARVTSPVSLETLNALHLVVREYEVGHAHAYLLDTPEGAITPALRDAIRRGLAIAEAAYIEALSQLAAARAEFWPATAAFDALIFPAAPDIAPVGMATGDARFVVPFTALGGPIASVPAGFDHGMPLGVMVTSAPGSDHTLLAVAERLAPLIETPR
jgi:aspartyl-tRNA(Asn)/glutamyl-tRNA(Gln) amidotransferase subunit A